MPDNIPFINRIIDFLHYQEEVYGRFDANLWDQVKITDNIQAEVKRNNNKSNTKKQTVSVQDSAKDNQSNKVAVKKDFEDCKTLDELHKFCLEADFLKTDLPDTNLVFGVGNPNADLVIVGEAPGRNEDLQGEPFVGRAGKLLNKILAAIGFERKDIYITNIVKHRPPNNRDPLTDERAKGLPVLLKQIDLINPKLILCLGRISAQTLLNTDQPMKALRGSFHPFRDKYELTVTYHPAALLRNPNWKRATWEDVQMLRKRYDELGCKP
jgi:DNA polymerase